MNALAHGAEARSTRRSPTRSRRWRRCAAPSCSPRALDTARAERDRGGLALGSILCAYALDSARLRPPPRRLPDAGPRAAASRTRRPTRRCCRGRWRRCAPRRPRRSTALAAALGTERRRDPRADRGARRRRRGGCGDLGADRDRLDGARSTRSSRARSSRTPPTRPAGEELAQPDRGRLVAHRAASVRNRRRARSAVTPRARACRHLHGRGPRPSAPPRTDEVISEERFQRYHAYAREHGVNRLLYLLARVILQPAFLIWFRLSRTGREHARDQGRADRRLQPPQLPRPVRDRRHACRGGGRCSTSPRSSCSRSAGRAGSSPGSAPSRSAAAQSDETAMETARLVARARRHGRASSPRARGSGRGSLGDARSAASAAWRSRPAPPVLPVAVHGTEHVRRGWRIRPRKVKLRRRAAPMTFPRTEHPSPGARRHRHRADLAEHRAAVGVARRPAAAAQGGGDRRRQLGHRGRRAARPRRARGRSSAPAREEKAAEIAASARTRATCPGVDAARGARGQARRARSSSPACDLVCLAVPSAALPAGGRRARRPDRLARLGAAADQGPGRSRMGALPERVRRRAGPRPGDRLPRRPRARPRGGRRDGRAGARQRRRRPARPARRGLRPRRPRLRAHRRRRRGRDGRRGQERRRARRRGRRAATASTPPGSPPPAIWRECVEYALAARRPAGDLHRASPGSAT